MVVAPRKKVKSTTSEESDYGPNKKVIAKKGRGRPPVD